jgi:hypothetical protein
MTHDDLTAFCKYLIEWTQCFKVDEKLYIRDDNDNVVHVEINKKEHPLMIYHANVTDPKALVLNPFKEQQVTAVQEEQFFIDSLKTGFRGMVWGFIKTLVDSPNKEESEITYDSTEVYQAVSNQLSKNTVKELERVYKRSPVDFLNIYYDKKSRTAQLQTSVFDKDYQESFGTKVSKKSWTVLTTMFTTLFGLEKIHTKYNYTATFIGMPKAECVWNVLYMAAKKVSKYFKSMFNVDLKLGTFKKYLDHLEEMHQMAKWLSTTPNESKVTTKAPTAAVSPFSPPQPVWAPVGQIPPVQNLTPVGSQPVPQFNMGGTVPPQMNQLTPAQPNMISFGSTTTQPQNMGYNPHMPLNLRSV